MPRFPRFLDRFRRLVAPPGRPSEAVGVPASGDDIAAEIGPLLEQLEGIGAEADRIVRDAGEEADRRRESGLRESEAILQAARAGAQAERARSAAQARAAVARDGTHPVAAGTGSELERLTEVRDERLDALVAEIRECIRRSGR